MVLGLPMGKHTYLMMSVLGTLSEVCSVLDTEFCNVVGCSAMVGTVVTCKILFLTFLAMYMMVFWAMASALCANFPYIQWPAWCPCILAFWLG